MICSHKYIYKSSIYLLSIANRLSLYGRGRGERPHIIMKIGIDVGISTTKIVGITSDLQVVSPTRIKATDPVTSLYGAFGKFLFDNHISLSDIEKVMITGVGAEYIEGEIYGLPTIRIPEFVADAQGAKFGSGLSRMITVSMGTGTTIIRVDGDDVQHLGGLGMGGGTLIGLSRLLLGTDDVNHIVELASQGNISNINLNIGDISPRPLPGLPLDTTASLFGKAGHDTRKEDIALGIICTVIQTICSGTVLASKGTDIKDFVMIGNLTLLPQTREIFNSVETLYGVHFIIPKHSEYCTAIGCCV